MVTIKTTKYSEANLPVSFSNQEGELQQVNFKNGTADVEDDFADFLCKNYKYLQLFDKSKESAKSEPFDFATINIDELETAQIRAILSDNKLSLVDVQEICKGRNYPTHEWTHKKRLQLVGYIVEKIQKEREDKAQ